MTQLLAGVGQPVFIDTTGVASVFRFMEPLKFKIDAASSEVTSMKMVGGRKVVAGAKLLSEESKLTLSVEAVSWEAIEIALGIESKVSASLALYEQRSATIPATGAAEIVDADITATTSILPVILEPGPWGKSGKLELIASGAPNSGQYRVDTASNKLIFAAAQAGAPIAYAIIKNRSALRTIGKEPAAAAINQMRFEGLAYSESSQTYKIVIPRMIRTKTTSLDFGEKTVLDLEYRMLVAPGQEREFFMVEMP